MLSIVVFFLLLGLATCDIEFLTPTSGQEFATNQSIPIKWRKIAGASNYSINGETCDASFETFKDPSKCKPRLSIGPLQEGNWNVSVSALNQIGDVIESGMISVRVCQSPPCSNQSETAVCPICQGGQVQRYYVTQGYKILNGTPDFTFFADNEQACVDNCTNNTQGLCKSASFDSQSNECEIYSTETFPQGTAQLVKNTTAILYEKVFIEAGAGNRCCPGPLYIIQPHVYMGGTTNFIHQPSTTNASDFNDCFQQCMAIKECKSGTFFTDSAGHCILKSTTRSEDPGNYQMNDGFNNRYFEPGCV